MSDFTFPLSLGYAGAAQLGLTKREFYATHILAGLMTDTEMPTQRAVEVAVETADLLIKTLEK